MPYQCPLTFNGEQIRICELKNQLEIFAVPKWISKPSSCHGLGIAPLWIHGLVAQTLYHRITLVLVTCLISRWLLWVSYGRALHPLSDIVDILIVSPKNTTTSPSVKSQSVHYLTVGFKARSWPRCTCYHCRKYWYWYRWSAVAANLQESRLLCLAVRYLSRT